MLFSLFFADVFVLEINIRIRTIINNIAITDIVNNNLLAIFSED